LSLIVRYPPYFIEIFPYALVYLLTGLSDAECNEDPLPISKSGWELVGNCLQAMDILHEPVSAAPSAAGSGLFAFILVRIGGWNPWLLCGSMEDAPFVNPGAFLLSVNIHNCALTLTGLPAAFAAVLTRPHSRV
jgi:hypothetical protein